MSRMTDDCKNGLLSCSLYPHSYDGRLQRRNIVSWFHGACEGRLQVRNDVSGLGTRLAVDSEDGTFLCSNGVVDGT